VGFTGTPIEKADANTRALASALGEAGIRYV
jgi:type I site-specific restriction-modification system R (restriction) subunit